MELDMLAVLAVLSFVNGYMYGIYVWNIYLST